MIFDTILTYLGCIFIGICTDNNPGSILTVVHSWQYLEYEFDSPEQEGDIIQMNTYDFRNNLPVDVEVAPDGRIFMTALRKKKVLASLMTISNRPGTCGGPLLRPYPNWSWANTSDCDNIIQVHRMAQDGCNRLWVVDSGKIDDDAVCPPKLLAFDLSTDELVQRIDIPKEFATNSNGTGHLANLVIEKLDVACEMMNIYMADTYGYGLVIWNGTGFWRIESSYFDSDPNSDKYSVAGTEFHEARGLLGMAVTPDASNELDRLFYFRPLASYKMYHTNVSELHTNKDNPSSIEYFTEPTDLLSQSVVHVFSSRGILFFSRMTEMSILCWNRHKSFTSENIVTVAQDNETLQYAGGMKIYPGDPSESLWIMTDRGQEFIANKMNFSETNFRILVGSVDDLVRGTNCE